MGISDKAQALIVLIAGIMITLGSTQVPADTPDRSTVILVINFIAWIGIAIKEYLGAQPNTPNTPFGNAGDTPPQPKPITPTNPQDPNSFTADA